LFASNAEYSDTGSKEDSGNIISGTFRYNIPRTIILEFLGFVQKVELVFEG
jgi:hypothetical protein